MPILGSIGAAAAKGFGMLGKIAAAVDEYFEYVTLLLHGNGTNGAQNNTFLDSSTNNFTITRNGNTTQGAFTPYEANGYWSNYFDGTGDYLQLASNSAFNMNTYCCLEAWVCYTSLTSQTLIVGRDGSYWLGYDFTSIGGTATKFVFTINNGSWVGVSSTTSPVVGVWYHVVGIKDNTTLRIYINGVQENTATFSGTAVTPANVMGIGANQNTQNMAGYISNARLVLGASASVLPYTANFSPVTTPLTAVSGTSLLTCQSNRFKDNSTNNFTLTVNGSPSVQAFQPFPGATTYSGTVLGGSGYFDGSGDELTFSTIAVGSSTAFCCEAWVYVNSLSAAMVLFGGPSDATGGADNVQLAIQTNGSVDGYFGGTYPSSAAGVIAAGSWYHIAWTRSGTTGKIFVNGVEVASGSSTSAGNINRIGSIGSSGARKWFNGYVSNARIVVGSAVYTSAFTPPTAPVTAITNTNLLLNFTNGGIIDNAMMNDLETVGNAQISTSVSKFGGGSLAFDGSGDWLQIPNSQNFNFGSGNFTVEGWVYCTNTTPRQDIFTTPANGSGYNGLSFGINNGNFEITSSWSSGSWQILFASAGAIVANTWYHFAIVRNGGTLTVYINGTSTYSNTTLGTNSLVFGTDPATISYGRINQGDARYLYGNIDDFRVTKGAARYTANFTPQRSQWQDQ